MLFKICELHNMLDLSPVFCLDLSVMTTCFHIPCEASFCLIQNRRENFGTFRIKFDQMICATAAGQHFQIMPLSPWPKCDRESKNGVERPYHGVHQSIVVSWNQQLFNSIPVLLFAIAYRILIRSWRKYPFFIISIKRLLRRLVKSWSYIKECKFQ